MTSNIIFCRQNHTKFFHCKCDKTTASFLHNILLWKRINQKSDLKSRLAELYFQCSDGKMNKENSAAPFWCIKVDPTYVPIQFLHRDEFLCTCSMNFPRPQHAESKLKNLNRTYHFMKIIIYSSQSCITVDSGNSELGFVTNFVY